MIPYGRQLIDDDDVAAVIGALRGEFLTTGPLVEQFEYEIEKIVGAPAIAVSSGTAALHCAYAAIQLRPGDEVITPPNTFIATQAAAVQFGAKIVFADIQPDTGNIDPAVVESLITTKTKAIVAVDYAGHPAELDELRKIADSQNIFLIEDSAHSIGSEYKRRKVGSIADLTTFSFFPTKNFTTAEGGAIASPDQTLLRRARKFSRQGLIRDSSEFIIKNEGPWHQEVHEFGLNYRMPDVLCALGISQIKKLENFKSSRDKVFNFYQDNFRDIEEVRLPTKRDYVNPIWHLYPIHVPEQVRKDLYSYLHNNQIKVQVNYLPAHLHPAFHSYGYKSGSLKNSEQFYRTQLSLPMSAALSTDELAHVAKTIKRFFK
jgi:dTDP-4-amino-4,6-dideoxygalactose transaminase